MREVIKAILVKELEKTDVSKRKIHVIATNLAEAIEGFTTPPVAEETHIDPFTKKNSIFDPRPEKMKNQKQSMAITNNGDTVETI